MCRTTSPCRCATAASDAFATNSVLLSNGGSSEGVKLKPEQKESSASTAVYFADEHALNSLGLTLIAGRNFTAAEITDKTGYNDLAPPAAVIVTRALAEKLFPGKGALGQSIYIQPENHSIQIIGIVDRLQVPWVESWSAKFNDNSILEPFRFIDPYVYYVVRVRPGQLAGVRKAAEKKLFEVNRSRVLEDSKSLTESRAEVYQDDRGLAVILGVVCAALVAVTAFGVVGLTSYWVAQRRRQIGIRRALGATRYAIVRYFQIENLMIAAGRCRPRRRLGAVAEFVDGHDLRNGAAACRLRRHRRLVRDAARAGRGAMAGREGRARTTGAGDARNLTGVALGTIAACRSLLSRPRY